MEEEENKFDLKDEILTGIVFFIIDIACVSFLMFIIDICIVCGVDFAQLLNGPQLSIQYIKILMFMISSIYGIIFILFTSTFCRHFMNKFIK